MPLHLSHQQITDAARALATQLLEVLVYNPTIYAIPRGGIPAYYALASVLHEVLPAGMRVKLVDDPKNAGVILDDLYDSGMTMDRYAESNVTRAVLFSKGYPLPGIVSGQVVPPQDWVVFPWEHNEEHSAEDIPRRLLQFIGEDPNRGGLLETPKRMLRAWKDWTWGYSQNPAAILKVFEDGAENYDEMVLVSNIPVFSKCEHHAADIFGLAHIAYIPDGKIVGLSKMKRLVDIYARRLQVQERMTRQVADALQENLNPKGVGVVMQCRHMCMESRGVSVRGAVTTTSAMLGVFHDEQATREEFLRLVDGARNGVSI